MDKHPVYNEETSDCGKMHIFDIFDGQWEPFVHLSIDDVMKYFTFVLKTHNFEPSDYYFGGFRCFKTVGLYIDVACTQKATTDGQLIAAWKDELTGSDIVFSQSNSSNRPVLKFIQGKPVLRFIYNQRYLESGSLSITSPISFVASFSLNSSSGPYSRILSAVNASNEMDYGSAANTAPILLGDGGANIGVVYNGAYSNLIPMVIDQWMQIATTYTGSQILFKKDDATDVVYNVNTTGLNSTFLKIGGAYSTSSTDSIDGYISAVCMGNVRHSDIVDAIAYFKTLSPTLSS